jgi:hypothetical protein
VPGRCGRRRGWARRRQPRAGREGGIRGRAAGGFGGGLPGAVRFLVGLAAAGGGCGRAARAVRGGLTRAAGGW